MIGPLVDLAWWHDRRDQVALADVRWYLDGRSGTDAYDEGHLPGALFVDLNRWLTGDPSPQEGRHPLPDPEVFAEGMARLGIADEDTVVAYDDDGGVVAARLVWMLRTTGHEAALLDGGLGGYGGPLERRTPQRPRAVFTPRPWPADRLADIDDAADPANVVLDARSRDRYRGENEPVDPRPGHIPGARSLPCRENLDDHGRFLPAEQLRQRFRHVGVTGGESVVSYCGSGVTACSLSRSPASLPAGSTPARGPSTATPTSGPPPREIRPAAVRLVVARFPRREVMASQKRDNESRITGRA